MLVVVRFRTFSFKGKNPIQQTIFHGTTVDILRTFSSIISAMNYWKTCSGYRTYKAIFNIPLHAWRSPVIYEHFRVDEYILIKFMAIFTVREAGPNMEIPLTGSYAD